MNKEQLIDNLKNYKKLLGYIANYNLSIQELDLELGPSGISGEEKVQGTNKFSSETESQAMKLIEDKGKLEVKKEKLEIIIKKIDNAINTLPEHKGNIIRQFYIEGLSWLQISGKINFQSRYCKQLRNEAIEEMLKIINNEM